MPGGWARIGKTRSVNPAKRELRIAPEGAGATIEAARLAWLRIAPDGPRMKVVGAVWHGDELKVTLAAGVPREVVGAALKRDVEAPEEAFDTDATWDGIDVEALIGFSVLGPDGAPLGEVVEVYTGPRYAGFKVESEVAALTLPAIEQVIDTVDPASRILRLRALEGFAVVERHAD